MSTNSTLKTLGLNNLQVKDVILEKDKEGEASSLAIGLEASKEEDEQNGAAL